MGEVRSNNVLNINEHWVHNILVDVPQVFIHYKSNVSIVFNILNILCNMQKVDMFSITILNVFLPPAVS